VDEEAIHIMQHIDAEREQLGRNLDEIEGRVRKATDVKHHFDRHTAWILGSALVGGFLFSQVFRKSSTSVRTSSSGPLGPNSSAHIKATSQSGPPHLNRVRETLDDILDGLVAVASSKLSSFVADAVPGFQEHYAVIERHRADLARSLHQRKSTPPPGSVASAENF
jgi:hypothetical protein